MSTHTQRVSAQAWFALLGLALTIWLITGIVAGWLAGLIVKGGGFALLGKVSFPNNSSLHNRSWYKLEN